MDAKTFCYWLQGAFELTGATEFNEEQTAMIKEHLQLVFTKVTGKSTTIADFPIDLSKVVWPQSIKDTFNPLDGPTIIC